MSKDGLPWEVDFQLALRRRAAHRTDVLLGLPGHGDAGIAVADVTTWDESKARGSRHAEGARHRRAKGVVAIGHASLQLEPIWLQKNS